MQRAIQANENMKPTQNTGDSFHLKFAKAASPALEKT